MVRARAACLQAARDITVDVVYPTSPFNATFGTKIAQRMSNYPFIRVHC